VKGEGNSESSKTTMSTKKNFTANNKKSGKNSARKKDRMKNIQAKKK
jgi:hypothetical protein